MDTLIAPFDPEAQPTWYQWGLHKVQAVEAWGVWPNTYYIAGTKPANAVKVGVIDTGIDVGGPDFTPHPDFINSGGASADALIGGQVDIANGRNVQTGYDPTYIDDDYGHGTAVSGIVAAAANNDDVAGGDEHTAGLGYNCQILPVKALDNTGYGTEADLAAGIIWAVDHGALIVNISAGDYFYAQVEMDAVNYAWEHGTMIVAAGGNDGDSTLLYPAALPGVMGVAATCWPDDYPASYSNFGNHITVSAPGGDYSLIPLAFWGLWVPMPTSPVPLHDVGWEPGLALYQYQFGTSLACPMVVGLAALYAGSHGITQATPGGIMQMWSAILRGCDDIAGTPGWSPNWGWGRINAYQTMLGNDNRGATVGCILGQVTYYDTVVQNATVEAVPVGGGSSKSANTRDDGVYRISNLTPGLYDVTASYFGEWDTIRVEVETGIDLPRVSFDLPVAGPTPFEVTAATYVDETHVDAEFSEAVDETSAETPGNYVITNSPAVLTATRDANTTTVHLATEAQSANTTYTVTVSNVTAVAGSTLDPAHDSAEWTTPGPPILEYAGTTGYESDGVEPDEAGVGTEFTFKVKVHQPDGTAPDSVELSLWGPLGEAIGSPFTMNDDGTSNWVAGVVFSRAVTLEDSGQYEYRFAGTNSVGPTQFPEAGRESGPYVNEGPLLSWSGRPGTMYDGVAPNQGVSEQDFYFRVKYTDVEGDPPQWVKLRLWGPSGEIAGSPFPMDNLSGDTTWSQGVVFSATVNLTVHGWYAYRFLATDGTGIGRLPTIGLASGPLVNEPAVLDWSGEPGCMYDGVAPNQAEAGHRFLFMVKYSDPDGDAPRWVKLRLWNAMNGQEIPSSPRPMYNAYSSTDWTGGVIFAKWVTLNEPGTYQYRFVTNDGFELSVWPTGPRALGPLVDPAGPSSLTVSGASAQQVGSTVAVTYTLSAAAEVEATIRNVAGRAVMHLASSGTQEEGINVLHWNGRNLCGSLVPSGLYLIQVTAKAAGGNSAQILCPLNLRR